MNEQSIELSLIDNDPSCDGQQPITIVASPRGVSIAAKGFGDCGSADGHGSPIFVELHQGRLRLFVWSDINEEDPTHKIDLERAAEIAPLLLAKRSIRQGGLTPLQEGRVYYRLTRTLNPATGKNFTVVEIADSLGVSVNRCRNRASLWNSQPNRERKDT